jgi:hypothetical protein
MVEKNAENMKKQGVQGERDREQNHGKGGKKIKD